MTDVLLCVGNSMMGDDGAGPLLAEMCAVLSAVKGYFAHSCFFQTILFGFLLHQIFAAFDQKVEFFVCHGYPP